jgi:hypothetical protein
MSPSLPSSPHKRPRHRVQLPYLGVGAAEHHRVISSGKGPPPVGDHRLTLGVGVACDRHPLLGPVELERLRPPALAHQPKPLAVERPLVADLLAQVDRLRADGDEREEAPGHDLGQLPRVADEDELGLADFGVMHQPGQRARVDHRRLVDQEHRALGHGREAPGDGVVELV